MPCDKDFGYARLTRGLTCGHYGDLCMIPKDNMCNRVKSNSRRSSNNLHEAHAMSSTIRVRINCSRVRVNCSQASVKLHLSCTVPPGGYLTVSVQLCFAVAEYIFSELHLAVIIFTLLPT